MRGLWISMSVLALMACPGPGGGGPGNDAGTDGGTGGDGGTVRLTGMVKQASTDGGNSDVPLAGAMVTLVGTSTSTTSGADGTFSLDIPGGVPSFIQASASGFWTAQRAVMGTPDASVNINPVSDQQVNSVGTSLGITIDATKGVVSLDFERANGTGSDRDGGYGATLSQPHGQSFSFALGGAPTFTTTTIQGGDATLIFPNVDAGTTTISPSAPAGVTCTLAVPVTNWRVDPRVVTEAQANCQ